VLRPDRLLQEQWLVRCECRAEFDGLARLPQAGVGVERELPLLGVALTDLAEVLAERAGDEPEPAPVEVAP
jgi:hypothetical protein